MEEKINNLPSPPPAGASTTAPTAPAQEPSSAMAAIAAEEREGPQQTQASTTTTTSPTGAEQEQFAATTPVPGDVGDDEDGQDALEIDDDRDSGFTGDDALSDTTSIASSMIRGHIENGRKYNSLRDDYWGPSDDQQFETMDAGHLLYLLLNSDHPTLLFRSPVASPEYILDIGTGSGTWSIDAADKFPEAKVYGVDLYPPPTSWVPSNCFLEVEDVLSEWTWRHQFDLIHMRLMLGAFTEDQWGDVYRKCYDNLKPGGWIEEVELDVRVTSDDGSLGPDSLLAGWGQTFLDCASRAGRSLATQTTMKTRIEQAGFTNIHDQLFKCPIGPWPKNKTFKEAGRINFHHWSSGLDGWAMFLLTKFGAPKPWTADEVRVYVAKVRRELMNPRLHIYHFTRRV
ncbi:hypothetical protein B0A50_06512 [Salinomyces thailandicus]|uniref:S-adenosyl-L-methionine-dependent methyltransferase n=1 Tax=Salinomyces thailandicus TaxID=706561 RepID=A0A4U0TPB3_9PEZI|nr:hypothetical protein B0A50_06512 [Salinomyces thailandica]